MKTYIVGDFQNQNNFSIAIRKFLKNYASKIGDELVSNAYEADYILTYADFKNIALLSQIGGKKKVKVLVAIDDNDVIMKDKQLLLNSTFNQFYTNVDEILVLSEFEKNVLISNNITTKITVIDAIDKEAEGDIKFKNAFKNNYQLLEKDAIISFSKFTDNNEFLLFEKLVRNLPDKMFFYFDSNDREIINKSLQERLVLSKNVKYYKYFPCELYPSMFYNVKALLITSKMASYPTVILDFINRGIPLITSPTVNMKDIINEKTSHICYNYEDFFFSLKKLS